MDKQTTTAVQLSRKKLGVLFSAIASEADALHGALREYPDGTEKVTFYSFFALVQKIGFLADLGAQETGEGQMTGGVEWFLPPSYHWDEDGESDSEGSTEVEELAES